MHTDRNDISPNAFAVILGIALVSFIASVTAPDAAAQMPRERAEPSGPVIETFWAPAIVFLPSAMNLPEGNLNFTIHHVFGIATEGPEDLFGLDAAANIRFGLDMGITDRWSVGAGRSRYDKAYDVRTKLAVLRQKRDDSMPVTFSLAGDVGVMTLENGFEFADRLSYYAAAIVARKFTDDLSIQITPMMSHFNAVYKERAADDSIILERHDHFALGIAARYVLSNYVSLSAEYIPVLSDRSDDTTDAFSAAVNIETGGHVFQLFLTTSQWITPQYTIARNTDAFLDGDFRFGFNVNRVF